VVLLLAAVEQGFILYTATSRPALGLTQPPKYPVPEVVFPEVKRTELEVDHSSPSCAEFKNECGYTSILPYVFMAWYLIKQSNALPELIV
jgi:hypothetical protein